MNSNYGSSKNTLLTISFNTIAADLQGVHYIYE